MFSLVMLRSLLFLSLNFNSFLSFSLSLSPSLPLSHSRTHLTLVEQITERDKFMSPTEAHDFGIIDHVLTHSPKQSDSEAKK